MKRYHGLLTLTGGLLLVLLSKQVLAQAESSVLTKVRWQHYLTAATPEPSIFSSQSFGYQAYIGRIFAIGLHGGPAFRHERTKAFAPLVWGRTMGISMQASAPFPSGISVGGYLRFDQIRAGFAYQGFRQNPNSRVREAGPQQRARFEQDLLEIGALFRFSDPRSPLAMQIDVGTTMGTRGLYTPTDIYPDYENFRRLFETELIPHNQANRHIGLRYRLMLSYRIAG